MNKTAIQWTDFTANPIRYHNADGRDVWACVKKSDGCTNCYAEALALNPRMVGTGRALGTKFNAGEMAKLTPYIDEAELGRMLRPRTVSGKRVFVGDMTDVFGEWVPDVMLDRLFAVFALRPDVTWQVLTKRPERMRTYLSADETAARIARRERELEPPLGGDNLAWPLPNVWLGVSVEDQQVADSRIPELLATPAAVRFLSCEPLLGPVDLEKYLHDSDCWECVGDPLKYDPPGAPQHGADYICICNEPREDHISWVIVGGESGAHARPCDVAWLRSLVAQCRAAAVPVFVKQLGSNSIGRWLLPPLPDLRDSDEGRWKLRHPHGGDPAEWPEDLRVREFPAAVPA